MEHGHKTQISYPGNVPEDAISCQMLRRYSRWLPVLRETFGLGQYGGRRWRCSRSSGTGSGSRIRRLGRGGRGPGALWRRKRLRAPLGCRKRSSRGRNTWLALKRAGSADAVWKTLTNCSNTHGARGNALLRRAAGRGDARWEMLSSCEPPASPEPHGAGGERRCPGHNKPRLARSSAESRPGRGGAEGRLPALG